MNSDFRKQIFLLTSNGGGGGSDFNIEVVNSVSDMTSQTTLYFIQEGEGDDAYYVGYYYANNGFIPISTDTYTKDEVDDLLSQKQGLLTQGTNITIANGIISAKDTTYTISASVNQTTYVCTFTITGSDGTHSSTSIDLPMESVVVNGWYNASAKTITLELKSGATLSFSVADLVSGLQTEITPENKLSADLVDDTTSANKFVTAEEKEALARLDAAAIEDIHLEDYADADELYDAKGNKKLFRDDYDKLYYLAGTPAYTPHNDPLALHFISLGLDVNSDSSAAAKCSALAQVGAERIAYLIKLQIIEFI